MCGISGVWQYPGVSHPERSRLEQAGRLMRHRGPDHLGVFVDHGVGLVHTRLSLVDLNERSNQPFSDSSGKHVLVYNGEIYNFRELREELVAAGDKVETTGDTEVLLYSLIRFGVEKTLSKIEGMYAFAWYDRVADRLVLARDPFGMKPLFYHDDGQTVCFGSEVQALTAWLTLRPDPYSIAAWLQRASPPSQGFTMYSGIQILPPGMILQLDRSGSPKTLGQVDLFQFLDIDYAREIQGKSTRELVDLVDEKLSASVEMQLAADVPVGAFCSGGVDSSVVMAMAAKRHKDLAIFHANVVGRHSEYDAARQLAEHLKLDLLFVDVHDQDFLEHLPIVTQHFGHPIAFRQDSLPLYLVSRLVQSHGIRAVISGEGADEIFLGYKALMPSRTNVLAKLKPLPIMFSNLVKRIVQGRYAQFNKIVNKPNLALGLLSRFETEIEQTSRLDRGSEKATLSLKMLHYHLRTLLHRNDAIGMSASIECRFPMLDRELVRLAVNLPYPTKIRNSFRIRDWRHPFIQNKWILRKVASRYVPKSLSLRPKRPFPTNAFERMQISAAFLKQSSAAQLLQLGTREIDFLVERGAKELLVLLLHLSVWCDVCLNDEAPSEVTKRLCSQITITPDRYQA